jgi:hypothetical protein
MPQPYAPNCSARGIERLAIRGTGVTIRALKYDHARFFLVGNRGIGTR